MQQRGLCYAAGHIKWIFVAVAIELIGSVAALIVVLILWIALRDRKPPE